MPDPAIATSEAEVWSALQVDLAPEGSPPEMAPVDAAFIRRLIVAAEARLAVWTGIDLLLEDEIAPALQQAVEIDVAVHYFSRLNPILPDSYFEAIAPFREWGFGAAETTE